MATNNAHTMREIDLTLARTLKRVRALARAVNNRELAVRAHPRTRTPGPNTYKRMTTGQLATAALAGAAIYHWNQQEEGFFEAELATRGLDESLATWRDDAHELPTDETGIETPRFDHTADSMAVLTTTGMDNLASAVDEVILGGDGRVPGALPPAEVIEDMQLTGADPDAIVAYEQGVGASVMSPTDMLDDQAAAPDLAAPAVDNVPVTEEGLSLE